MADSKTAEPETTMQEDVDAAWDEDKARDYPEHNFDDSAAEDSEESKTGFIGGTADLPKQTSEDEPEKADTDDKSDTAEPSAEGAEAGEDAPEVDAELRSRAKEAGLSSDEVSDFSEAQLRKVLTVYDRALIRPAKAQPIERGEETVEKVPDDFDLELDPEYHDPEVIKAFKALDARHQAQNNELRAELGKMTEHMQRSARQQYQEGFDRWLEELPDEYAEFLGTGSTLELDEDSDFFKRRSEVAMASEAMRSRITESGNAPPSQKVMLKRGLHAILGDNAAKIESAIQKKKENKRSKKTTARPSHRRERDPLKPPGDRAAYDWANKFLHEEGITQALDEGLPTGELEGI